MAGPPLGFPLPDWTPPPRPGDAPLIGRWCKLERLSNRRAEELWAAYDGAPEIWTYIGDAGPFSSLRDFRDWFDRAAASDDPRHFAVIVDGRAIGTLALMRIAPERGSIELGYIVFAPRLQRTRAATEAAFLCMRWAFESGYRRFEWKCNALNAPSRAAARRFGLCYEGIFRRMQIDKGRNRDTAWYAAIDAEWPALKSAFERWLDPANFDEAGRQRRSLRDWTAPLIAKAPPER